MESDNETAGCKIVDFGLSKIIGPNEQSLDPFGTLSYVAPEVLLQKKYGKEVDVWSLGVISYLLLSRVLPFDDEEDKEIARQTIQDAPDFSFSPWDEVSKESIECVTAMLEKNRSKRPNVEAVMNMPWFKEFKAQNKRGKDAAKEGNFKSYALTSPNDSKLDAEVKLVQQMQDEGK
jgi:serine/threonine protein kinase